MFQDIYKKIEERPMPEIGGTGTVYEHVRTGAKVFAVKAEDPNKVFYIGFRTTPSDSTGVAHILEHSVLCGSEKFPLKDPFVELVKGSLNTFLNAMTYPDKTVYPVASCNDRDFMNLMDVYLDAIFHPRIYSEKKIFEQEGWHYEVDEKGELSINGVVYNEMKGVYSSPDAILERYTMNSLFPHTTYGVESGGDPEVIPQLSYENFLRFHGTYYHPSNAYIYLYGDMDMEEKLLWMDENYLSKYDRKEMDTRVTEEPVPAEPAYMEKAYAVNSEEGIAEKNYLSENYVIPGGMDNLKGLAWEVLEFILLNAPGAPLKEALVKAGIGEDIYGGLSDGIRQPYFSVIAKNAKKEDLERFRTVIRDVITDLCENGLSEKSLRAALNYTEFKYREADSGRMPAGLDYGLTALDSWLYDRDPFEFLRYEEEFKELKKNVGTGWYERLLRETLLENGFRSTVVIVPKPGLTAEKEEALKKKLSEVKKSLTAGELDDIRREAEALTRYQEEPDGEEAKKTLPRLSLSDIGRDAEKSHTTLRNGIIHTDIPTRGIAYIRLLHDISGFTEEEVQYVSFLKELYGEMDTEDHSYVDLSDEVLLETGGISFGTTSYMHDAKDAFGTCFTPTLTGTIRVLESNMEKGLALSREIFLKTDLSDGERVVEKLLEAKARQQAALDGASHVMAVSRAGSYLEASDRFDDLTGGVAFSDFLSAAAKLVKEPVHKKRFLKTLSNVADKLKTVPMCAVIAGSEKAAAEFADLLKAQGIVSLVPGPKKTAAETEKGTVRPVSNLNEGLKTGSQVNYVARTGRYSDSTKNLDGSSTVLRVLLNYDYLWTNLRVKGGAYGCMAGFSQSGKGYLVSYRDPHLKETDDVYVALPEYLRQLEITDEELLQYVIGAVATLDHPVSASVKAGTELANFLYPFTDSDRQAFRDSVVGCSAGDLRAWGGRVEKMLSDGSFCVIGSAGAIEKEREKFNSVRELY